jgi:hypothetical protein
LQARAARGTLRPGDTAGAESLADGDSILSSASDAVKLATLMLHCVSAV